MSTSAIIALSIVGLIALAIICATIVAVAENKTRQQVGNPLNEETDQEA